MENYKLVKRFFFSFEVRKEEMWLNEMMMDGWKLKKVGFARYEFEACLPESFVICIETCGADEERLSKLEARGISRVGQFNQWNYYAKPVNSDFFERLRKQSQRSDWSRALWLLIGIYLMVILMVADEAVIGNLLCGVLLACCFRGTFVHEYLGDD